jgi:hypothetical protein
MLEHTLKTTRNVRAAIVVARQPGYFQYYKQPPEVEAAEKSGAIAALVAEIRRLQGDIDAVTAEAAGAERDIRALHGGGQQVSSLRQWLAVHGRPVSSFGAGFTSQYVPSKHVYGGTKHYPGFKSHAVTLVLGRGLR